LERLSAAKLPRQTMLIPIDQQYLYWGWPGRLIARMEVYDGEVIVGGPAAASESGFSGLTLPEQLTKIPSGFNGYVWTDDTFALAPRLFTRLDDRTQAEIDATAAAMELRRDRN
jgi:glycerophosphoryl diester phosphodiesterase